MGNCGYKPAYRGCNSIYNDRRGPPWRWWVDYTDPRNSHSWSRRYHLKPKHHFGYPFHKFGYSRGIKQYKRFSVDLSHISLIVLHEIWVFFIFYPSRATETEVRYDWTRIQKNIYRSNTVRNTEKFCSYPWMASFFFSPGIQTCWYLSVLSTGVYQVEDWIKLNGEFERFPSYSALFGGVL